MKNSILSNKKYILLLIGVLFIAIVLFFFFRGKIDLTEFGKIVNNPTDTEDNLSYGKEYHPVSNHVLERDNVVIKNFGSELKAQDLETGICVEAGNIAEKSGESILSFSEYVGYLYMYDGKNVYRITVNNPEQVRTSVEDCLKFEPMGNYLYSIKEYNGKCRLFRCSITGTNEKILFRDEVEDFWVSDGNLFMQLSDGQYRWYNVVSQNNLEHTLPEHVQNISLDGDCIYYMIESDEAVVYRRRCDSQEDTALPFSAIANYNAADGKVGLLISNPDGSVVAAWCQGDGSDASVFEGRTFSPESVVDITANHLFVTEKDGTTWVSPLDNEEWHQLFEDTEAI